MPELVNANNEHKQSSSPGALLPPDLALIAQPRSRVALAHAPPLRVPKRLSVFVSRSVRERRETFERSLKVILGHSADRSISQSFAGCDLDPAESAEMPRGVLHVLHMSPACSLEPQRAERCKGEIPGRRPIGDRSPVGQPPECPVANGGADLISCVRLRVGSFLRSI
jgi:hypothetical protein